MAGHKGSLYTALKKFSQKIRQWGLLRFYCFSAEQDRWILWIPVLFGTGIGISLLSACPLSSSSLMVLGGLVCLSSVIAVLYRGSLGIWILAQSALWLGAGLIWSTLYVEYLHRTPLLLEETEPLWIEGNIRHGEQRPYGYRMVLDHIRVDETLPLTHPHVRPTHTISLLFKQALSPEERQAFIPGSQVRILAVLMPWTGPNIPGGYHSARAAAWEGCMAHGYGLKKPFLEQKGVSSRWDVWRHQLNEWLASRLPAESCPIAQALVTGERGGISAQTRQDFANTGLAHLLAISGLHMSLVMGIGFTLAKRFLGLIPFLGCGWDVKKWAALPSMLLGGAYLMISGAAIPAQRSWFMGVMVFIALILNREPLSMRTLACAAMVILTYHPPALLNVSFQLSFAAVLALLSFYEYHATRPPSPRGAILKYLQGAVYTSTVATLATTPIIIATFNRMTLHSVTANLVAVPWTCFVAIPLGMICLGTSCLGLEMPWLWKQWHHSLEGLHQFAHHISNWPGSEIALKTPSLGVQATLLLGSLWLLLWKKPWRWWGVMPLLMGGLVYSRQTPEQIVLIHPKGPTYGLYQDHVLHLSSLRSRRLKEDWAKVLGASCVSKITDPKKFVEVRCNLSKEGEKIWHIRAGAANVLPEVSISDHQLRHLGTHRIQWGTHPVIYTVYNKSSRRYWDL